ncbi:MAG: NPCBM/NEW2 domain-containing protein [Phycisphaerae bacterium]|nr:NPCBM/NEW2 domain-containing protein [Phycisphaerae bacterium]
MIRAIRDVARWASVVLAGGVVSTCAAGQAPLSSLDLTKMSCGWGKALADKSVEGKPMSIGGRKFERGVGAHAPGALWIRVNGARRFSSWVGVDDETAGKGTVRFMVYGDGRRLFDSGIMKGGDSAKRIDVEVGGLRYLLLATTSAGDGRSYDHTDWAEASFAVEGAAPTASEAPAEEKVILTPAPGPKPRVNGPRVYGVRPGRPLLYRIPCTGERPMRFGVDGLPAGLEVDRDSGIIRGKAPERPGEYPMALKAVNRHGSTSRMFTIVVGETLALAPPMGWNSWYIHYNRVTDADMRAAADAMIGTGMAEFGYQYVNIDDCWMKKKGDEPYRDKGGAVLPNAKFPDMTAMCDYIHDKGLKAGLYTSPGPWTCAGYVGAYKHEETDARKFAEWGFDFLKYDWCSYSGVAKRRDLEQLKRPYQQMGDILKTLDRDIVLNLCQYGMGEVWKWGGQVGGNCWRTTGDLGLEAGGRLPGCYSIGLSNARHYEYAKPGQWNDPDYILIGWVGNARGMGEGKPTTLTGSEQYGYMSMWSLMAAPLIFSGDMTKLDAFTLNVLCNAEVIEVNQDTLGKQARIVKQTDEVLILAKPLDDGSVAVGVFNLDEFEQELCVTWSELGIEGPRIARDLWRQKDLGRVEGKFSAKAPRHGVAMVRLRALR